MASELQEIKAKYEKEICPIHKQSVSISETKDGLIITSQCCNDFRVKIEIAIKKEERELTERLLSKHNRRSFE